MKKNSKELQLFLKFIKKFYAIIIIYIISEIFRKYIEIYTVQVIGNASDSILNKNMLSIKENMGQLIIALGIAIFVVPWITFIAYRLYTKVGVKFDTYVYNKFLRQRKSLVDSYDSGDLIYRIEADPVAYRGNLLTVVGDGFVVLFIIIQVLFIMLKIHRNFAFICFALSMIPIFITTFLSDKIEKLYEKEQEELANILNEEKSMIENFAFIKVHHLKKQVLKIFHKVYSNYYKIYKKKTFMGKAIDNFNDFFNIVCQVLIYIIGSYYISIKGISIGEGIKFFGLSLILKENSQLLRKVLERYFEFKVSSKRIIDWTEQNEHSGTIDIDDICSIKGNNISFGYNDKNVFNNLSFSIEKGDHEKYPLQGL
ncbi:ABC transporter transmembrane domain-containing protein [Hathewaya massiliensis]|uniref:ABC transporter transmembrane domain-containing protein n=1 Tax=Hathewaya massiliensis TaxID=1964382 RepID=UPI0011578727|nr:ABC transporter transmembrane domain-containing protein [Hathewaya massiliensis]